MSRRMKQGQKNISTKGRNLFDDNRAYDYCNNYNVEISLEWMPYLK